MNQELTQRIIGAIVVTALAAIFIPMLFEDPVDNSGQTVSELVIPEEPAITVDDSVSKLPRNIDDIAPLPDETAETPDKIEGDLNDKDSTTPPAEEEMTGDPIENDMPGEEPAAADNFASEDQADMPAQGSLDTGEVGEVTTPAPKISSLKPESEPAVKPETIPSSKKTSPAIPKTISKAIANPVPVTTKAPAKPAKNNSGLVRWYLQAGSFSKKENALSLSESIRKQGLPVILETLQTSKGPLYRLRVGPELDKKRAATMKSKLDQQNISSILVSE